MDGQGKAFPETLNDEEREEVLSFFEERFQLERNLFKDYIFLRGSNNYWLFPMNTHLSNLKNLTPETVGLLCLRRVSKYLKPTSAFLQRFGRWAKKNIVTLTPEQFQELKLNKKVEIKLPLEPGYVILKYEGWILGCGLYSSNLIYSFLEERILITH